MFFWVKLQNQIVVGVLIFMWRLSLCFFTYLRKSTLIKERLMRYTFKFSRIYINVKLFSFP